MKENSYYLMRVLDLWQTRNRQKPISIQILLDSLSLTFFFYLHSRLYYLNGLKKNILIRNCL